jgi:hypothetical protein
MASAAAVRVETQGPVDDVGVGACMTAESERLSLAAEFPQPSASSGSGWSRGC